VLACSRRLVTPKCRFDRLCIDQANIAAQLPALPVYLAGCKRLLALQGHTYIQRIWCVIELHVFCQMGASLDQIVFVRLDDFVADQKAESSRSAQTESDEARLREFDVRHAEATDPDDKARLLAVIEGSGEGIAAFNEWVRKTVLSASSHFQLYSERSVRPSMR
jgi:hypothetical protein